MKILTVNLPVSYIKAIKKITGSDKIYPSRSELMRVAVREYLLREMVNVEKMGNLFPAPDEQIMKNNEVSIPNPNEIIIPGYGVFRKVEKIQNVE